MNNQKNIIWFNELRMSDIELVGGKNASLGEMISQLHSQNILVPNGFAITTHAYRNFLRDNNLKSQIDEIINKLDKNDIIKLSKASKQIQDIILNAQFSSELNQEIEENYVKLCNMFCANKYDLSVAVRSSATSEDLPNASFAGQQDTLLNISGINNIKLAIKHIFASLYNDRAISYRYHKDFNHENVFLSVGIQKMVRSDLASSGVIFTIDTESGFSNAVLVTSNYGLGESVVQGIVNPDEFYLFKPSIINNQHAIIRKNLGNKNIKIVFNKNMDEDFKLIDHQTTYNQANKINLHRMLTQVATTKEEKLAFSLTDDEVNALAKLALTIEKHYKCPVDIEWAKDGVDNQLYILQARPETVKSNSNHNVQNRYIIKEKANAKILVTGSAIGQKAISGKVRVVQKLEDIIHQENIQIDANNILVTDMTDPDWEPIMKKVRAIVTNRGGRTCHAAIIARELGVPAIVGCENATTELIDGMDVTVSCCEGESGFVYQGILPIEVIKIDIASMPQLPVKIMLNVANPELVFNFASVPNYGVGLARLEFIVNRQIGIHPKALLEFNDLPQQIKRTIEERISGYKGPVDYYITRLAEGIATIAAGFYPKEVIVRLSDFKSNEYSNLIGGKLYEPNEENPMLGFRGASRYTSEEFQECFALECQAINFVRYKMGINNISIMVPFVRTVNEAREVISILKKHGIYRAADNNQYHTESHLCDNAADNNDTINNVTHKQTLNQPVKIYMMCEIPANALLAEEFLEYFDGFSIGSNDMTQLTLGIDRDAGGVIGQIFDERDASVKKMLSMAIDACKKHDKYVGICGQGPSDYPDFAEWLIEQGIDSISLNPDSVIDTWLYLAKKSAK